MKKAYGSAFCIGLLAVSSHVLGENMRQDPDSFTGWMGSYATKNSGKVSRQAYMDEAGRRWDAMDKDRRGLTVDQINRIYGYGPAPTNSVESAPGRPGNAPKGG